MMITLFELEDIMCNRSREKLLDVMPAEFRYKIWPEKGGEQNWLGTWLEVLILAGEQVGQDG